MCQAGCGRHGPPPPAPPASPSPMNWGNGLTCTDTVLIGLVALLAACILNRPGHRVQVGMGLVLVAGATNWKYQVQVDSKARAALFHVCRPRWKLVSPCPCQVLSLSLAVQCQWAPAGPGWSGPSQLPYAVAAAFGGRPEHKETINKQFTTISNN